MENRMEQWQGKRVLITGVCGTVGLEILRQLLEYRPAELIGLDNNESALFFLSEKYREHPEIRLYLGDVRDRDKLYRKMKGVDVVFHTAALKHVVLCEKSPRDAIQTNVLGIQNVIDAALANDVQRVLFTSSDKAVNPTNVMGTSKLMGERLITAATALLHGEKPIFTSTRFGNVLGSHGSVIPLFKHQIATGGPVTLTDPGMTRFIMTLEEAVRLVMDSVFLALGGEVFVTKMRVVRIADLAQVMIEELSIRYNYNPEDIKIQIVGVKPGEKMYEELLNEEEVRRTLELEQYFVVIPAFKSVYNSVDYVYPDLIRDTIGRPYNSKNVSPLDKEALRLYLHNHNLLENSIASDNY